MYTKPQSTNLGINREAFNAAVKDAVMDAVQSEKNTVRFNYLERKLVDGQTFTRADVWELHIVNLSKKAWTLKCVAPGVWKVAE
jgi:hypothetical protein